MVDPLNNNNYQVMFSLTLDLDIDHCLAAARPRLGRVARVKVSRQNVRPSNFRVSSREPGQATGDTGQQGTL